MIAFRHVLLFLGLCMGLVACQPGGLPDLAQRGAPPPSVSLPISPPFANAPTSAPDRANADILRDFLDLSFAMESGRPVPRMSRFEGPITVTVRPGAPESLGPDLDHLLARLRREARIDISRLEDGAPSETASITIETLPRARMQRQVPEAACFVVPRVRSWAEFRRARRSGVLDWTTLETREQVAVFIPEDVSAQEIRDCLHEELAQAIGPLNDLYRLSDSVFNDDNMHAVLTGFDMLILRAYYSPELRSGLNRAEAAAILPGLLDRLNPAGRARPARPAPPTPAEWVTTIETALGAGATTEAARLEAAEDAVQIAEAQGLSDVQPGFSHFALARLSLAEDAGLALHAFRAAAEAYARAAPGGIHAAHVDMHLAVFALGTRHPEQALRLTTRAYPAAEAAQNAALMSLLLMIRAEALEDLGQPVSAQAARLDSLVWGRYGFSGNAAMQARLSEVAALSP